MQKNPLIINSDIHYLLLGGFVWRRRKYQRNYFMSILESG